MKLQLYIGDEGVTDSEFRDGDIFQIHDDAWEPGNKEKQRFLTIQMADYPGNRDDFVASEYMAGPGGESVIRRLRKYRIDYASKLTPEDLVTARDRNIATETIVGVFSVTDITRK